MLTCGANEELEFSDEGVHGERVVTIAYSHEAMQERITREDAEKIIEYLRYEFAIDA